MKLGHRARVRSWSCLFSLLLQPTVLILFLNQRHCTDQMRPEWVMRWHWQFLPLEKRNVTSVDLPIVHDDRSELTNAVLIR